MTLREVSPRRAVDRSSDVLDDANQLPAYTPVVDESTVLVPNPTSAALAAPSSGSPKTPASASSYATAEQEKAQLQAQFGKPQELRSAEMPAPQSYVPPQPGQGLGHASEALLSRGLQVPTSSRMLSSGFPYPEVLEKYGVSTVQWDSFTAEITGAAKMTPSDWMVAMGGSAGTFLAAGLFIGWWAIIPAVVVGRSIQHKRETENAGKARDMGELEAKLLQWNQDVFAPRGLLIRLDLPGERYDIGKMDVFQGDKDRSGGGCGGRRREAADAGAATYTRCGIGSWRGTGSGNDKKMAKYQKKMEKNARKAAKREEKVRNKIVKRGRIVILPLNNGGASSPMRDPEKPVDYAPSTHTDLYASSAV